MRRIKLLTVLLICMAFVSCAALGITAKPWADRTPKEKALAILDAYNAEFTNTMNMALRKDLTEAQKQVVRAKKELLKQAYPLIQLYLGTVEGGGIPSKMQEQEILNLLDQLGGKL